MIILMNVCLYFVFQPLNGRISPIILPAMNKLNALFPT